jgi:hypothetical protein
VALEFDDVGHLSLGELTQQAQQLFAAFDADAFDQALLVRGLDFARTLQDAFALVGECSS